MLMGIELAVLHSSLTLMQRALSLMDFIQSQRGHVDRWYDASVTDNLQAGMAVVCSNGQRYSGTLLLQPLLQLLVPAVRHLLEQTAAEVEGSPGAHKTVQRRVALVLYTSYILLAVFADGKLSLSQLKRCTDGLL
jgi:hypothetical protein